MADVNGRGNGWESAEAANADSILERAAREGAVIQIVSSHGATTWHGLLLGTDEKGLSVRVISGEPECHGLESLRARLIVDGASYAFETERLDRGGVPAAGTLRIRRPAALRVEERRRARRTGLHPSARVELQAVDEGWRATASILNLSEHGMAARAEAASVGSAPRGTLVRLAFLGAEGRELLDFRARVASVISTDDRHVVAGLEFVMDERYADQLDGLRDMLERRLETQPVGA